MGLLEDSDKNIYRRYQELCVSLNMDKEATEEAWQSYETIRQNYSLEGDQLHWLGCALYVACRRSTTSVVGKSGTVVEGNCVSLTKLLRLCKLSLIQFFNKSRKWADMASMPPEFRSKIDILERNFAVSMVIFKKFQPIFMEMFVNPVDSNQAKQPSSRKQRSLPCTPAKVFDFTWTLFVCVKEEFPGTSEDLVNSYHLLLACCDMIFANALLADRRDILNPQFRGLPDKFWEMDYTPTGDAPCIIDDLCKSHDGISLEAKGMKEYCWKSHVRKLFEKKILKGDSSNLTGILDPNNFDFNFKNINRIHEEHVLNVGDFDERIFLGEDASADIGTPTKLYGVGDFAEKLQAKKNNLQFSGMQQLAPSTPLTGRKYLKSKEAHANITPVSTATQSVSRLQTLLAGRQSSPGDALIAIFKACSRDPNEKLETLVKDMGNLFCTSYTKQSKDSSIDFARKRLQLAETLFYKLLENILLEEKKRKPLNFDFSSLLENDAFLQSLFACSLEVVIYSYNSQRTFPWVLEVLGLWPYHFYKVIELIVRVEDQLSRDTVKHLNRIEEEVLESMAWRSESPLWQSIRSSALPVPSCEDVFHPGQLEDSCASAADPAVRRVAGNERNVPQSPVSSVTDRFPSSPVPAGSVAKKRLFQGEAVPVTTATLRQVKPGQSLLQASKPFINIQGQPGGVLKRRTLCVAVEGENGQRYNPILYVPGTGSVIIQTQPASSVTTRTTTVSATTVSTTTTSAAVVKDRKAKRTDSLGLFFRKFYSLAAVRMQELCKHLELTDPDVKKKIWTCFEHSIIQQTDLMQDRHLDQILMCAVYVICRVAKTTKTFMEIMHFYRQQPQAASHVYRSVLLRMRQQDSSANGTPQASGSPSKDSNKDGKDKTPPAAAKAASAPPTPTHPAGTSTNFETEERGDLIKFYNEVYVKKMQAFAVKFSSSSTQTGKLTLSPLPLGKNQPMSPCRRISDKHSVFIRSLEQKTLPTSPTQPLSYCFSRSPAKDLQAINSMIHDTRKVGKRLLVDDSPESGGSPAKQPAPAVTRKLQNLIGDRMGQAQD